MNQFITLSKNSPEFESYLLGTFADDRRALPVESLNVNSASEMVTFKVVSLSNLNRPSAWYIALKSLKVRGFLLLLVPMFLVLTKNMVDNSLRDTSTTIFASLGLIFSFIAMNLRNDFMDHIKGIDRIFSYAGSRAIQNGWLTAIQVKNYSVWFLLLAMLCAVPVIFSYPEVTVLIFSAMAIGLWAQFKKQNSFKYRIGGEVAMFLLLGPLLTVGYQLSMGAQFDWESFYLGCVWGWGVLFVLHLRNFTNILISSQAGFQNTINWLGFDKSRRLLAFWWLSFVLVNLFYHYAYAGIYWGFYLSVTVLMVSASFISKLKTISSPVGSELRHVFRYGFSLFLVTVSLWVFECLWYLAT